MRQWVIVAIGEGAAACVLTDDQLYQDVHDFMCVCGREWQSCASDFVPDDIRMIDDPEQWTSDEAGEPFSISWEHECGCITLYKLRPLPKIGPRIVHQQAVKGKIQ